MIHFTEGSNDFFITLVKDETGIQICIQANKDGHPFPFDTWIPAIQEEAMKAMKALAES